MCVKDIKIYFIGLKKDLFGVILEIEEIRDKDNATGLNKGGAIEMSIYSAFHIRDCTLSFASVFTYLSFPTSRSNADKPTATASK